jgi:hypothetical protein
VWLLGIACVEYRGARLLPQSLRNSAPAQAYPVDERSMKGTLASGSGAAG